MKHYLNFIKTIGVIEISEPFGFDGSTHKIEQETFYGRDVVLGDEEIKLTLTKSHFELINPTQQLTDGTPFNFASHGFEYFVDELKNKGWESEIEYILQKDGVEFSKGIVDAITTEISKDEVQFQCIQNTKRELVKRRLDVNINAFSDKDLDGNNIQPCVPVNLLLKAKPIIQKSNWKITTPTNNVVQGLGDTGFFYAFNFINEINASGIEDTLSYLQGFRQIFVNSDLPQIGDFVFVEARSTLSNFQFNIQDVSIRFTSQWNNPITPFYDLDGTRFRAYYYIGSTFTYSGRIELANTALSGVSQTVSLSVNLENLTIESGQRFYFWFEFDTLNSVIFPDRFYRVELLSGNIDSQAISTSIDSVAKAVRFIDLLKHACKSVGLPITIAPSWDIGGEHYDNYASNGYLLGQVTDRPFNNKLKDLLEVVKERNNGYQINPENIEVLHHDDFYKETEIGAFIQIPQLRDKTEFDSEQSILTIEYSYKNSSKDRETNREGSIDDVHGQTQWVMPSKKVEKTFKVELDHIRSAFLIEEQRRRLFTAEKTTSLSEDTKLFLIKATAISPTRKGGFTASLLMQVTASPNGLKILSNGFDWTLLGFATGSIFTITQGQNIGSYTVSQVETGVVTLLGVGATFNGTATITVEYNLNDVNLINETFEPFSSIEGVENSQNYSNLRYSIKRNLKDFYSMLGSFARYLEGQISNTLFEVNGNLSTRLTSETESLQDNAHIDINEIKELRRYEPRIETINVFADFDSVTDFFNKVATDKGYVRVMKQDNTVVFGYVKEAEYKWSDSSLEMKLRPKKESEFYDIDINLVSSFQINNNLFVSLYDVNDIMIVTPLRFDKIRINGVIYTDEIEFAEALTNLIQS